MRPNGFSGIFLLLFCVLAFSGCRKEDDGLRGFMCEATVLGDSVKGFHCYLDGGGLVISHDRWLKGIERGYFAFHYTEEDWQTDDVHGIHIANAHVYPEAVYKVIRPVSREEAGSLHVSAEDTCRTPDHFTLGYGWRGYFDLYTGVAVMNSESGEKASVQMNMIYDPDRQTADTLLLQFCYHPRIPDAWNRHCFLYGSASCDISSFASLRPWSDSVNIVVEVGDKRYGRKISKEDFLKPELK
ncbi:MAG: hypothetical protein K2I90_08230 [Odoribacter sp.]|nr:hypothetical protein [Odoribacter sp.]